MQNIDRAGRTNKGKKLSCNVAARIRTSLFLVTNVSYFAQRLLSKSLLEIMFVTFECCTKQSYYTLSLEDKDLWKNIHFPTNMGYINTRAPMSQQSYYP